jgi:aminopeptidase N
MKKDQPKVNYLKDYQPPAFEVSQIDLIFRLYEDKTHVISRTAYKRMLHGENSLWLDGKEQELKSIRLNGENLGDNRYQLSGDGLTVTGIDRDEFILEIETVIYPHLNTALEGLYVSNDTFTTQCEAEGFRKITYYPDRPDVMAPFKVRIEADKSKYPVLLSNGNLTENGDIEKGRHYALWEDPFPKPSYLFALVAGDLVHIHDTFTTVSGKNVDLYIYCRSGDEKQCGHAMRSLKKAMKWDEEKFGREYDLDIFNIVAVSDFNMGAMENKSLNIFNTALVLAHPETATDTDFMRVETVIAHEYFHNWTGNRITCRDWFQLSLKEGLTVYRDQEFSADMNSAAVQRIDDVTHLRRLQFPEDSGPMAHPVRPDNYIEISNFYTTTVYDKGAEVIRMMEKILGKEGFRKGMDLYFGRHDGQAVTCMDFVKCMEDANEADLSQFRLWYEQAGTPEIRSKVSYDAQNHKCTLSLSQRIPPTPGQKTKEPMHIPVAFGLLGPDGEDMAEGVLSLKEEKQDFVFDNINAPPVASLLRGFSAPVKLKSDHSDEELRFLMIHDNDGFNSWEAGQTLALRKMGRMLDLLENGGGYEADPQYIDTYSELLDQAFNSEDKLLLSKALILPDVPIIAQHRKVVDPSAIYEVRQYIIEKIAGTCHDRLLKIYETNTVSGGYGISPEDIARRGLKNTALKFLASHPSNPAYSLLRDQYTRADNMTDRFAALSYMIEVDAMEWRECHLDFYERYKEFQLVIDKWFAILAMAVRGDTHEQLHKLRNHPDFNMKNPNRVRSLYAAFAMNNPVKFHDKSGEGYRFLGDAIKELDYINPSIAARLLTPLREWRRYTPNRQAKMKEVLEDIASISTLSKDVYEVVSKTLAQD